MPLWTPYAETSQALDLSKNAPKPEPVSPPVYWAHQDFSQLVIVGATSPGSASTSSNETTSRTDYDELETDPEYIAYQREMLRNMELQNGGSLTGSNPRMRRSVKSDASVDVTYRFQREKNNMAAKQSRDRRKLREVQRSIQISFLMKKLAAMKRQLANSVCVRCHANICHH